MKKRNHENSSKSRRVDHCMLWSIGILKTPERLRDGNREEPSTWNISHLDSKDIAQYIMDAKPSKGSGGCLYGTVEVKEITDILF